MINHKRDVKHSFRYLGSIVDQKKMRRRMRNRDRFWCEIEEKWEP